MASVFFTSTVDLGEAADFSHNSSLTNYSQFLGPNRTAVLMGLRLDADWETTPPKLVWKRPIGEGWSAFSVHGSYAVTQEQSGDRELVVAYHLLSGKVLWQHGDQARYRTVLGGTGPRATPTIAAGRVYTLGATGILNCLELTTGSRLWSKDILKDNDATGLEWGMSGSPLLIDSLVVVCAGGPDNKSLVAYHHESGERVWAAGTDRAGYSSPMLTTLAGTPQILIFNNKHVVAHVPTTGDILWKFPWPGETQRVAQPLVLPDNRVFITSGYGVGSKLIRVEKAGDGTMKPVLLWQSKRLKAKFTNVVHHDGFIYGLDDGILVCLDLADGQRRWKRGRYGHGQLMLVADVLLILSEKGDLALVEATPEGYSELAHAHAIEGKTWNNPALAGTYLLVRNHREAACFELPLQ